MLFKGHGLWKFLLNYFKSFPCKENKSNATAIISVSDYLIAIDEQRAVILPKENLNDIIRYFDEEVKHLHERLAKTEDELRKDIQIVKTELNVMKSDLGKQVQETKQLISDSNVSNVWLDVFGISIIFVGLIYGTVPDIVEKLIW